LSYFLYIAHLPLISALEILLLDVPLPPLIKVALVLVATIALLLPAALSHHAGNSYPIFASTSIVLLTAGRAIMRS
jgi:peptidoglycan/LPS O-acetylase OafA/YrhL